MVWNKPKGNPFTQSRIAHGYFLDVGSRTECLPALRVPRFVLEVLSGVTNFKNQYKYPGKIAQNFIFSQLTKLTGNHVPGAGRAGEDVLKGALSSLNIFIVKAITVPIFKF